MSFHGESFWVTVGAAAPVIALAGVVSISDFLSSFDELARLNGKAKREVGLSASRGTELLVMAWAQTCLSLLVIVFLQLACSPP